VLIPGGNSTSEEVDGISSSAYPELSDANRADVEHFLVKYLILAMSDVYANGKLKVKVTGKIGNTQFNCSNCGGKRGELYDKDGKPTFE
jgi:hypothetical protein